MDEPILTKFADNKPENIEVFWEILNTGCKFAEMLFHEQDPRRNETKALLKELTIKMFKVIDEKYEVTAKIEEAQRLLDQESSRGVKGIEAIAVSAKIENFLVQGKAALDVAAKLWLPLFRGTVKNWHHLQMSEDLRRCPNIDENLRSQLCEMLASDWNDWLEGVLKDRNEIHQENLKVSAIMKGRNDDFLPVTLRRADGTVVGDVRDYIEQVWTNLFQMVTDVVRLAFACHVPILIEYRIPRL
ncbi:MAG: hypothetical protein HYV00_05235 [Deltaproteobacteria bacterium]|nr:hypothetical protein [Deltaproteobacteria bacterium]